MHSIVLGRCSHQQSNSQIFIGCDSFNFAKLVVNLDVLFSGYYGTFSKNLGIHGGRLSEMGLSML